MYTVRRNRIPILLFGIFLVVKVISNYQLWLVFSAVKNGHVENDDLASEEMGAVNIDFVSTPTHLPTPREEEDEDRINETVFTNPLKNETEIAPKDYNLDELPFRLLPSPEKVPFKPYALVLLLTSTSSSDVDFYFQNVLSMIYHFQHVQETKLRDDVEIAIIVSEDIPKSRRETFLAYGARVIMVENIRIKGLDSWNPRWQNCFTKLYMFKMKFYRLILFYDSDMFFLRSPTNLFKQAEKAISTKNVPYFFGSVQDYGLEKGTFNAGVMLFQPSDEHFKRLLELAPEKEKYDDRLMEQGLLNWYFKPDETGPGKIGWFEFEDMYDIMWLGTRPEYDLESGVAIHEKMWWYDGFQTNKEFLLWKKWMYRLKTYQKTFFGSSDVGHIPNSVQELNQVVNTYLYYSKIGLFSLVSKHSLGKYEELASNRKRYGDENDVVVSLIKRDGDMSPRDLLIAKLKALLNEMGNYDWVLVLDESAKIVNTQFSLHVTVAKALIEKQGDLDIIVPRNCNGSNPVSFLLRSTGWTEMFLRKWIEVEEQSASSYSSGDLSYLVNSFRKLKKDNFVDMNERLVEVDGFASSLNAEACDAYKEGDFVVY